MTTRSGKTALITDLDDTLIDWLRFWHDPFRVLLTELQEATGVSEEQLVEEFQTLHRETRTSESSFLVRQLPSLGLDFDASKSLPRPIDEALHAYYSERLKHMKLAPGVAETLTTVRGTGALIVVFTEALDYYARERIRRLGLDGLVDFLYSPPDHDLPSGFERYYPEEHYGLECTEHRHLEHGFQKPDPAILVEILEECGLSKDQAVYVGDNPMKDVRMAQKAGVLDVHAAYGEGLGRDEYRLLQAVSHWTDEDMRREEELKAESEIIPSCTLDESFSELLDICVFEDHRSASRPEGA